MVDEIDVKKLWYLHFCLKQEQNPLRTQFAFCRPNHLTNSETKTISSIQGKSTYQDEREKLLVRSTLLHVSMEIIYNLVIKQKC